MPPDDGPDLPTLFDALDCIDALTTAAAAAPDDEGRARGPANAVNVVPTPPGQPAPKTFGQTQRNRVAGRRRGGDTAPGSG